MIAVLICVKVNQHTVFNCVSISLNVRWHDDVWGSVLMVMLLLNVRGTVVSFSDIARSVPVKCLLHCQQLASMAYYNKPSEVNPESNKLGGHTVQNWCLVKILPALIGEKKKKVQI